MVAADPDRVRGRGDRTSMGRGPWHRRSAARLAPLALAVAVLALLPTGPASASHVARAPPSLAAPRVVTIPPSSTHPAANGTDARHWIEVNASASVIPPAWGATADDPALGGIVLFGGESSSAQYDGYLNGTWLFRSGRWTELCNGTTFNASCPTAPPARAEAEMTYDAASRELLLFGGIGYQDGPTGAFWDTWALRNTSWVQIQSEFTAGTRVASYGGFLVDDPARGFVYLSLPDQPAGQTAFEFENGTWTRAPAVADPEDLVYYDPGLGALVASSPLSSSTLFELNGSRWKQIGWADSPLSSLSSVLLGATYDPLASQELAYVGVYDFSGENWSFETRTLAMAGGNWTDLDPTIQGAIPFPFSSSQDGGNVTEPVGFTFDSAIGATVLLLVNSSDGSGDAWTNASTWVLTDPLTADLAVSASQTDVGLPVVWTLYARGGYGTNATSFATSSFVGCSTADPPTELNCTYPAAGTYWVEGTVTDALGDSINATATVVVHPDPQAIGTTTEAATTVGVPVPFVGRWANGTAPVTGTWSFGDGTQQSSPDPAHAYSVPGTYNATWSVEDAVGEAAVATVTIVVNPGLAVDAWVSHAVTDAGLVDGFGATILGGTDPDKVLWEFGDGGTGTGSNVTYAYPQPGDYLATVEVTDHVGVFAANRVYVDANPPMVTAAGANLTSPLAGSPVLLAAGAVGGTAPYTYFWQLGDGGWSTAPRFEHAFDEPGVYQVTVDVNDSAGASQQDQFVVSVAPAPAPSAPPPGAPPAGGGTPPPGNPPSEFPRLSQQADSVGSILLGDAIVVAGIAAVLVIAAAAAVRRLRSPEGDPSRRARRRRLPTGDETTRTPPRRP